MKFLLCHPQLKKILEPEARESVKIIEDVRKSLDNPDHWKRVINWVINIQNSFPMTWRSMSEPNKVRVRIFALSTGASENSVHKDFLQASNIIDFMTISSREDLKIEMNRRSNPDY